LLLLQWNRESKGYYRKEPTIGDKDEEAMSEESFRNRDPFGSWNDPARKDDPFAPWNDLFYKDDPFAPWNDPFAGERECEEYKERNGVDW
jgi:hypothetical protein